VNAWLASFREGTRVVRSLRASLLACALAALGPMLAKLVKSSGSAAADDALRAGLFGVALPLGAYLAAEAVFRGKNLSHAARGVARHGVSARRAGLGLVLALVAMLVAATLLGCVAALTAAYPAFDDEFFADLVRSLPVAAIAALAYAGWYALASSFGARGAGRKWFLGLDWVLGASSGVAAAPWPRGHVRNLLGGSPVLDLSQAAAFGVLLAGTSLAVALAIARSRD